MMLSIISIRKKKRLAQMEALQDRIDTLKALPVQYLLNKVALMPKDNDTKKKHEMWEKQFEYLSNDENERIKEEINKIETMIYARKFKESQDKINELNSDIDIYENDYETILDDLTKATQIDIKNREEITNQKELFRNFKKMYESNRDNYKPYNNAIERYFKDIQDDFTNIDVLLNQSQVDKARFKANSLEVDLLKMKDILNNLPVILEELTIELPEFYTKVENRYNDIYLKKFNIKHLNIPLRLEAVNKSIVKVLSRNNDVLIKDLQDISRDCNRELTKMMKDLDEEVRASEQLDNCIQQLINVSILCDRKCRLLNELLNDVKERYILTINEEANLEMETRLLFDYLLKKNEVVSMYDSHKFIASDLENDANKIIPKFEALNIAFDSYEAHLNDLQSDERRLLEEYANMNYIIKDCEARLRIINLPILSQAYYKNIDDCKVSLLGIDTLLKASPLNIDVVKTESKEVCEKVYSLYDNARNLLKTAQMAENAIIFGNRFRSSKPGLNSLLNSADTLFNNGEYTKALSSAIEAIEVLFPKIKKELVDYRLEHTNNSSYAE
jgi:septation ring formation regulator EzrA